MRMVFIPIIYFKDSSTQIKPKIQFFQIEMLSLKKLLLPLLPRFMFTTPLLFIPLSLYKFLIGSFGGAELIRLSLNSIAVVIIFADFEFIALVDTDDPLGRFVLGLRFDTSVVGLVQKVQIFQLRLF